MKAALARAQRRAANAGSLEVVGAIELGTTSIRMVVAEVGARGAFHILDSLQQPVSLGRDAFTRGEIEPQTTEECVRVLRSFLHVLQEYGVTDPRRVRLVATSAVREAGNREAFLDRVTIATGVQVDVLNEAEVSRLTYLAVRPLLENDPEFAATNTIVVEVGGGSTETLLFRAGRVFRAHMYRLGSLRLARSFDEPRSAGRMEALLSRYIVETSERISENVTAGSPLPPRMLALGSEARFACAQTLPGWESQALTLLPRRNLERLTREVMALSVDETVRRYRLTYAEAETLAPALLVYTRLAEALRLRTVLVGDATLRSGLLADIATRGAWTREFEKQIISSALAVGRKYRVNLEHARAVAALGGSIFDAMRREHRLDDRYALILQVAALLHECGYYINDSSHHKHSLYLIRNSDIFGLGARDLLFAALAARYHRGSVPKPVHPEYAALSREDRITVSKLAAILRLANALDTQGAPRRRCRLALEPGVLAVCLQDDGDLSLERHRVAERSVMFERVYGLRVELRPQRS